MAETQEVNLLSSSRANIFTFKGSFNLKKIKNNKLRDLNVSLKFNIAYTRKKPNDK